jgi:hypothetical protein
MENGLTIVAVSANDLRARLAEAMRGHTIPDVMIHVVRDGAHDYMIHCPWRVFVTLIAERAEEREAG